MLCIFHLVDCHFAFNSNEYVAYPLHNLLHFMILLVCVYVYSIVVSIFCAIRHKTL